MNLQTGRHDRRQRPLFFSDFFSEVKTMIRRTQSAPVKRGGANTEIRLFYDQLLPRAIKKSATVSNFFTV